MFFAFRIDKNRFKQAFRIRGHQKSSTPRTMSSSATSVSTIITDVPSSSGPPRRHAQLARVRLSLGLEERTNDGRSATMLRFVHA